ncbi:hypothetical protein D3C80_337790 [compost metagenome]
MQRQRDSRGNPRIDGKAHDVHAEEHQEELHQKRRALEDADEAGGEQPRPFCIRDAGKRDQQTTDATAGKGDCGKRNRPLRCHDDDPELVDAKRSDKHDPALLSGSTDI